MLYGNSYRCLQFSRSSTDKTILGECLIQSRRLTITTTINDKLATIKIVKKLKSLLNSLASLAGWSYLANVLVC